jgi:hypothetical protein
MLELHLNSEGDETLVREKILIFALGRIYLWYFVIDMARTYRACIIGQLGVVGEVSRGAFAPEV